VSLRRPADPLKWAVESLSRTFPGKSRRWIKRTLMRLGDVREAGDGLYVVYGRRELGDWRQMYQVWYSEREGRWHCTCFTSAFGYRRRREICTHVAAVMLYRRYRKALEKLENKRVYVAEAEVECPGRLEANGELYVRSFASPKYRIVVISAHRRVAVRCSDHVIYEAEGEEVPLAVARFLVEKLYEGEE
jgi:hypothetical protein